MADTLAPHRPSQEDEHDVAQRHFNEVVGGASGPHDLKTVESPDEDRAVKRLREAEQSPTKEVGGDKRPVAEQEKSPLIPYNADQMSDRQLKRDLKARFPSLLRRRGFLIGAGAGGILSIVSGMMLLFPFKLPGLLDLVNDWTGNEVQHVIEHEAEKILLTYMLRGSNAAVKNGNVIVTGNPLGDLFANLRTARFEDRLKLKYGLTIDSNGKGGITLLHDGTDLGDFKNLDELTKLLNRNDLTYLESRRAIRLITRNEIPIWRVLKRFKYADFLRLKYIPFFGLLKQKPDESDSDYKKNALKTELDNISEPEQKELGKLLNCMTSGDCEDLDKPANEDFKKNLGIDGADNLADDLAKIGDKGVEDAVDKGVEKGVTKLSSLVGAKLATAGVTTIVGLIVAAAAIDHWVAENTNDAKLFKMIAAAKATMYATYYAFYAGLADQVKAGEVNADTVGMFSDFFNGAEQAMSFNIINSGVAVGEGLGAWQRINDKFYDSNSAKLFGEIYNNPGMWVLRAPLIAVYYTIGWVYRTFEGWIDSGINFIIEHAPCLGPDICIKTAMNFLVSKIALLWTWFAEMIGLSVDPLDVGAKAFNNLATGGTVAYDSFCKEKMDCHNISTTVELENRQAIAAENADINKGSSFFDRVLALDNPRSLASNLLLKIPTLSPNDGLGSMAFAGARLASTLPSTLGAVFSGRASAFGSDTIHDMIGNYGVGVSEAELDGPIAPELTTGAPCTINNDDHYDPCGAEKLVIGAINCDISVVSLCPEAAPPSGSQVSNPTTALPDGSAQQLAYMILHNPNISFEPGNDPGKNDFELVSRGEPITTCQWKTGKAVSINTRLMQVILATAGSYKEPSGYEVPSRYKFRINAVLSDHDCDEGFHPLGQAVDLGWVNGANAGPIDINGNCLPGCGLQTPLYRDFATFIGNALPPGGRIGQLQCLGKLNIPSTIIQHTDVCHHVHIAVSN